MALFPKEQDEVALSSSLRRNGWTREQGTRKLLYVLGAIALIWFVGGKIRDHFLLSRHWEVLKPDPNGLTVVGTLNSRGSYDSNMFKIITANKSSHVELTDYGWKSIFDPSNGPMFSDENANTIEHVLQVDGVVGYLMLEPFLRAGVAKAMGSLQPFSLVKQDTPIDIPAHNKKPGEKATLGELLERFGSEGGPDRTTGEDADAGGSLSGRQEDKGHTIPGENLINVCPVVLTTNQFSGASLEEHPASIYGGKWYTVHLNMTPEGRSRFFQWSHSHVNESLVFVLKNQVATAARVTQELDVDDWEIKPLQDEQAAKEITAFVNAHAGK